MDKAEIARLAAKAAEAKAAAAQAAAQAAEAAYKAALASAAESTEITKEPPQSQSPEAASSATCASQVKGGTDIADEYREQVAAGYTTENALPIGVYLADGEPVADVPVTLPLQMLNRHGLVAGATGTGKTRTLQLIAEGLSDAGVPVFITDIKGDLTGLIEAGVASDKLTERSLKQGQNWVGKAFPTEFFALGGLGDGTPVRTTVTDFGPLLLARVLGLNDTQESALSLIFHWADQQKLGLIDLGDLRDTIAYLTGVGAGELETIGGVSSATAGVILRELSVLQTQGADDFFGEPAFDPKDFMQVRDGRGVISCLELPELSDRPALFSTFVMWLLAELFEIMPETGDVDKPKLVFFFDEAHLLFDGATKAFMEAVVKTVRLIRSKGIGVFFVTQTPKDIPEDVLAQLGAKVQHALRAHTPNDAKALRETVKTFPTSPLNLEALLPSLGTGEAIVTVLDEKGRPSPVAPTKIWAPAAVMGVASQSALQAAVQGSQLRMRYADKVDPESATELLAERVAHEQAAAEAAKQAEEQAAAQVKSEQKAAEAAAKKAEKAAQQAARKAEREAEQAQKRRQRVVDNLVNSAVRTIGNSVVRSIFGNRKR